MSKRFNKAVEGVDRKKLYKLDEAIKMVRERAKAKFDETIEIAMNLGVDPKHADQMVRGTVVLPHGLGKSKKVLVIASGEKVREAEGAGADFVGGKDLADKIAYYEWRGGQVRELQGQGWSDDRIAQAGDGQ